MKTMKYSFYISVVFTCVSLAVLIFDNTGNTTDKLYDISLAIFGSALLAAVTSLIAYFSARKQSLMEYYRCLERTTNLLKIYRECDEHNIDSEIPRKNLDMLKAIRTDNLIELKDRYDDICFLFDSTRNKYRKFIYASYDYIQDIEIMTERDQVHLVGSSDASLFENLNHIFVRRIEEHNISREYDRVSDDMRKYLIKYRKLVGRKVRQIVNEFFKKDTYCFKNSIVDGTTFKKLNSHYNELVKEIISSTKKQHNGMIGDGHIEFAGILLVEAKYLQNRGYIDTYQFEFNKKPTIDITKKLYYYEHFLEKYNEHFDPPLFYKRVTVRAQISTEG